MQFAIRYHDDDVGTYVPGSCPDGAIEVPCRIKESERFPKIIYRHRQESVMAGGKKYTRTESQEVPNPEIDQWFTEGSAHFRPIPENDRWVWLGRNNVRTEYVMELDIEKLVASLADEKGEIRLGSDYGLLDIEYVLVLNQ